MFFWLSFLLILFVLASAIVSLIYILCVFFFSSRRRHTRLQGDWSSDVCSSDLLKAAPAGKSRRHRVAVARSRTVECRRRRCQIGRASCRERGERWGGAGVDE